MSWRLSWELGGDPRGLQTGPVSACSGCLWSSGFIANRAELIGSLGVSAEVPDAEIAIALTSGHGISETARKLAGTFSFVLRAAEDRRAPRLFAVRDRTGGTDLCWRREGDRVELGSVRGLAGPSPTAADLDEEALVAHLCGLGPPPGRTMFRGVARVEPGELLEITPTALLRRTYWRPDLLPVERASDEALAQRLRELLLRVVGEYVPRPVAATAITLSGGLDSTSVAAALCRAAPETPPRALTWISPEIPAADESALSSSVCRRLGLQATPIRADHHWPLSGGIPAGTATEPDLTYYPELWEATVQAARASGVRVLFTGASGDNLFGGEVSAYPDLLIQLRWGRLGHQLRAHLRSTDIGVAGLARRLILTPIRRAWLGAGASQPPVWLTKRTIASACELLASSRTRPACLPGRRQLLVQLRERLSALVIAQLGRRAAEHGLELRHPLLDHRLVDFAASLPADQLIRSGERKFILRNAMRDTLPEEVLSRRGKIVPLEIFRRGVAERGREVIDLLLTDMRAADLGLVEPSRLREGCRAYAEGRSRDSRFWHALTLEAWLRTYV